MCTKPFPPTKNKGKLFLVATSSGPLLGGRPFKKWNGQFRQKKMWKAPSFSVPRLAEYLRRGSTRKNVYF